MYVNFEKTDIDRVMNCKFLFSGLVIEYADQILVEPFTHEDKLETIRLVRDSLVMAMSFHTGCKDSSRTQLENMTANVRDDPRPYFVR